MGHQEPTWRRLEVLFKQDVRFTTPKSNRNHYGRWLYIQADDDCTGHRYINKALQKPTRGLHLEDVWDTTLNSYAYKPSAARLDRIYATDHIRKCKQGIETLVAAFTDHLAVLFRVNTEVTFIHREKGRWFMNNAHLAEKRFRDKLNTAWIEWKYHIPSFQSTVHWWEQYEKKKMKPRHNSINVWVKVSEYCSTSYWCFMVFCATSNTSILGQYTRSWKDSDSWGWRKAVGLSASSHEQNSNGS
jgi:hypothetical protein